MKILSETLVDFLSAFSLVMIVVGCLGTTYYFFKTDLILSAFSMLLTLFFGYVNNRV
jgi:hypothetical protein